MLTKKELEEAIDQDYLKTLNELVECADLLVKGNRMLVENQLSEKEYQVLEEGLWEKAKYYMGKLGRYKAGGKITGKRKIDQEAGAKIQAILDKKGNEMIKALDANIKQNNPEFPNNEKGTDFLKTILEISAIYDSVVESTKKGPDEEGFLPVDAANTIIEDLAEYVKKFLDVDLAAAYSVMDSEKDKVKDGDEELLVDNIEDINEDEAADVRSQLQAKKGETERGSQRMETLKSNKLPLVLAGVGGALGALGWLAQTDFIKDIIIKIFGGDVTTFKTENITKVIDGGNPDAKGFLHWAGKIMGTEMKTGADVQSFIDEYGIDNVKHMFEGNGGGSIDQQGQLLQQLVGGDNASKSVGELFNPESGTFGSMKGGQNLFGVSKAGSFVAKTIINVVKKEVIKGAGTVIAAKVAGIGAILAPIGIGILATGALVKLMRMKGQKQSRAKTLNDLLQSLQPVKGTEQNAPVLPEPPVGDAGSADVVGDTGKGKNICNAKNLNELNKFLNDTKTASQPLKEVGKYQNDSEFQKIFLEAFISTTKSVKINKKPLLDTLRDLKTNGLLEAPQSMSGRQRKYLKIKLDLQNFMTSLMKLFSAVYKGCKKTSKTFQLIKGFFNQLFKIASQGKSNIADEKTRTQLWKKLTGNFSNFLKQLNKLPNMEKGKVEKTTSEKPKEGRGGEKGTEGTFGGSAPRTKPPQLAHYDRGDKFLSEEIFKIKRLMK